MTADIASLTTARALAADDHGSGGFDRDAALAYHLIVPAVLRAHAPILVAVHGISRNSDEYLRCFADGAAAHGAILVVPVFARERFPGYQRLGGAGRGPRADHALDAILDEIRARVPATAAKLFLFGHSGGGQFVHRYVMAHPERVARYVVSAAGWYTWPDPALSFPHGIGPTPSLSDLAADPRRFLRVPGCVLVGARDTRRGPTLNAVERIDRAQGPTRLARGQRWVAVMNARAEELGLPPPLRFRELPDAGHLFASMVRCGGLIDASLGFLLGSDRGQRTR